MALKKVGELLEEHDFESIHHELTMELKTNAQMVSLCKVLYEGLKTVDYVPSRLQYALITSEDTESGKKSDKIVAHADFMNSTISIHDLEPAEIVSTEVDLDDPELETLFLALCLKTLCEEETEKDMDDLEAEQINVKSSDSLELGDKEYDEDSLFPFKKNMMTNDTIS
ncbi:hypothetical protein [Fusibacter sp. JL216-2]|uniref:hypothetical protein n=1 Tax=Fusibacter sp. JL216-2 TaxID=3071453 RepID=UPI003D35192A